jgi:hypothetical protein
MCPCPSEDCERKGICCLCAQYHVGRGQKSSCMRDTERPVESCSLRGIGSKCDRYKENLEFCPCDYEPCENRGTCCDCVRNHWGNATYPSPACMRS